MESRAKQRLTGAVILVALFVLLVPELLTGPRDAHPPAAPTNEEGLRSYTIELDARDAATPATTAPANDGAVSLPAVPAPASVPGEAAAPQASVAQPPAANPQPPTARPNNVATAPAAKPQPTQPVHADAARSESPSASGPSAPPAAKPAAGGNFVVQLGTFGQRENADRLVREMNAKGFAAFVVPISSNGHDLYRVRVGPTRDRASAEALAAQLKRVGQSSSIVPIS